MCVKIQPMSATPTGSVPARMAQRVTRVSVVMLLMVVCVTRRAATAVVMARTVEPEAPMMRVALEAPHAHPVLWGAWEASVQAAQMSAPMVAVPVVCASLPPLPCNAVQPVAHVHRAGLSLIVVKTEAVPVEADRNVFRVKSAWEVHVCVHRQVALKDVAPPLQLVRPVSSTRTKPNVA